MNETINFKGTLESVNKHEGKKPYLKIKAIPEGFQKARTYNYHSPFEYKEAAEVATHIEETRQGLLLLIDSEIAFTYVENPNPQGDFPFKNIKEFTVEFKTGEGKVKEELVKDEAPAGSEAKREEEIAKSEKDDKQESLTRNMAYYVEVAKNAWLYGLYGPKIEEEKSIDLPDADKEAIQKIAVHLRMDKGRR